MQILLESLSHRIFNLLQCVKMLQIIQIKSELHWSSQLEMTQWDHNTQIHTIRKSIQFHIHDIHRISWIQLNQVSHVTLSPHIMWWKCDMWAVVKVWHVRPDSIVWICIWSEQVRKDIGGVESCARRHAHSARSVQAVHPAVSALFHPSHTTEEFLLYPAMNFYIPCFL